MSAYRKTVAVPVKTGSRDHRHANQRVIDSLDENVDGALLHRGVPLVDSALLERALRDRDLLLLPYVVVSYSTYLSLASGLPMLEMITFDETDPIAKELSVNTELSQYNAVLDTSVSHAKVLTHPIAVSSRYQRDRRPRKLWVSTMPSYEDLSIEIRLDDESEWYGIQPDKSLTIVEGFGKIQLRFTLPHDVDPAKARRTLYSAYMLYK